MSFQFAWLASWMLVGTTAIGFWPALTQSVTLAVAGNLATRVLAWFLVAWAITGVQPRKTRLVWGLLLSGLGTDTAAAVLFLIAALDGVAQSGPIITPLGDVLQLAAYGLYIVALLNLRGRARRVVDWRLPTLDVLATVIALSALVWIFVIRESQNSVALAILELGYPLMDFAMLAALALVRNDRDSSVPSILYFGLSVYIGLLFAGDALIGLAFYAQALDSDLLIELAGLAHGLAIASLGLLAIAFRSQHELKAVSVGGEYDQDAQDFHERTWRSSTLSLIVFFITLLAYNFVQLKGSPERLTLELIMLTSMGFVGLLVITRQVLVARRIERVLTAQVAARTQQLEEAQGALHAVFKSQESLLERAPIGISGRSAEGTLSYSNPAWSQMAEECPEIMDLSPENVANKIQEIRCTDVKGQPRIFLWVCAHRLGVQGETDGHWQLLTEVTDVKAREAQLFHMAKLATLGEMSTGLAHEMNQPLNAIRLTLANLKLALAKLPDGETLNTKIDRIDSQVDRAADLISHMRTYGRASSDDLSAFNLSERVDAALSLWRHQLQQASINLVFENKLEEAATIWGSEIQFEQVLINLISNARDAIESTGGAGEIHLKVEAEHGRVRLTVCDSGPGIPEALLGRIFEPFFTTKEVGKGVGLGCSISHGIISDMGGQLTAHSMASGGMFVVTLPLMDSETS
jgi:C4-dicarboxylate-specific signal transduction histidine kinase